LGGRRRAVHGGCRVPPDRGAQARLTLAARLLLEYDGTGFAGWATQPGRRTVQEELEAALLRVRREATSLTVAGRTDAGVHARGQVASHPGFPAKAGALNGVLPDDIRVLASDEVAEGFDARRDAVARTYRYRVLPGKVARVFERHRALLWRYPLDREVLEACTALLPGTHDFTAFTPTQTIHTRFERQVTRAEWLDEQDGVIAFWIEADTFMRSMVRVLVGTMLKAASGRMTVVEFEELLTGAARERAGDTVAAHGLYLESVRY
jgi:tRNA pseudouridine38-40 synthase